MRRGCISLGDVTCDKCHRTISTYGRYLVLEEDEQGNEVDKGKPRNYCVACAQKMGLATIKEEKGERTLTFFA